MTAIMIHEAGDVEKIAESIKESKRLRIPVLPPSVNDSQEKFTLIKTPGDPDTSGESIRFGLNSIKNFGEGIAKVIIDERTANGKFTSLTNFLSRIKDKSLNKKSLESLIKCGAMDEFADRTTMYGNIDRLLEYNKEKVKAGGNQDSLFGGIAGSDDVRLEPVAPITLHEKLLWEKELLGLYISGHPLDKYREVLEKRPVNVASIKAHIQKSNEEEKKISEKTIGLGCIIEEVRVIKTKKGEDMAFLKIADLTGSMEAVSFPKTYVRSKNIIIPDKLVILKGKLSDRNGEASILIDSVTAIQ